MHIPKPKHPNSLTSIADAETKAVKQENAADRSSLSAFEHFVPSLHNVARAFEEPQWDEIIARPNRSSNIAQSLYCNIDILSSMGMLRPASNYRFVAYDKPKDATYKTRISDPTFNAVPKNKCSNNDAVTTDSLPTNASARLYVPIARMASRFSPINSTVASGIYSQPAKSQKHRKISKACICDKKRISDNKLVASTAFSQRLAKVRTFWDNHNSIYPYTFKKKVLVGNKDSSEVSLIEILDFTNKVMDLNRLVSEDMCAPRIPCSIDNNQSI